MTVEELRSLYMKETNCDLYQSPFFVGHNFGMIDAEYIKWLEQKLSQPCPECEKIRKMLLRTYSCDVGKFTHVLTAEWNNILRWTYREATDDTAKQ